MTEVVSLVGRISSRVLTIMLVRATNTRTKTRYPFATVKSEEVKVSDTRLPAKTLATRTSYGLVSVGDPWTIAIRLTFDKAHTSKI